MQDCGYGCGMRPRPFCLLLVFAACLLFPACNAQYGLPTPGYGYPPGLSSLAPRMGSSGNYIYYPRFEAYYHRPSKQFYYPNGKNWEVKPTVMSSTPREVFDSPSVPFQFPNHPSKYHEMVKRAYPADWTPGKGRFDETFQVSHSTWDIDRR
jgi:hypothetical protein